MKGHSAAEPTGSPVVPDPGKAMRDGRLSVRASSRDARAGQALGRAVRPVLSVMLLAHLAAAHPAAAAGSDLPRPPCETAAPLPDYPGPTVPRTAPAVVRVWQAGEGLPRWTPPACTGWAAGNGGQGFRVLVALAGRIQIAQSSGADQLLGRFGAVSALREARYWSVSDGAWRPLVTDASALDGPNPARRRRDFAAAELAGGRDAYFVQRDGRSSDGVVYRLRVLQNGQDELVVQTENVTPIRLVLVTLFQPGTLQTVHFLHRLSPTSWGYYSLTRTTEEGSSSLAGGHAASYVNRAAAFFRFVAGVPTDRDPPLAR